MVPLRAEVHICVILGMDVSTGGYRKTLSVCLCDCCRVVAVC